MCVTGTDGTMRDVSAAEEVGAVPHRFTAASHVPSSEPRNRKCGRRLSGSARAGSSQASFHMSHSARQPAVIGLHIFPRITRPLFVFIGGRRGGTKGKIIETFALAHSGDCLNTEGPLAVIPAASWKKKEKLNQEPDPSLSPHSGFWNFSLSLVLLHFFPPSFLSFTSKF